MQRYPTLKTIVKTRISNALYDPITKKFQKRLSDLVTRNCIISGYSHRSVYYKGTSYNFDNTPPARGRQNRLRHELHAEMDELLDEFNELKSKEIPYVLGVVTAALNASNNPRDWLELLPENLHPTIRHAIPVDEHIEITNEEIEKFKKINAAYLLKMKMRMMTNLLE